MVDLDQTLQNTAFAQGPHFCILPPTMMKSVFLLMAINMRIMVHVLVALIFRQLEGWQDKQEKRNCEKANGIFWQLCKRSKQLRKAKQDNPSLKQRST